MHEQTGCDGVMIGRAAPTNPWIFRQIQQYVETGRYDEPTERDRYHLLRDYYRLLIEKSDKISGEVVGKMKQFASQFTRGVHNGSRLRKAIYHCGTREEIVATVDDFFEKNLAEAA